MESGLYPVIEIVDGTEYTINVEPSFSVEALCAFIQGQGRFTKSKISVEDVEVGIRRTWEVLRRHVRIQGASAWDRSGEFED